MRQKLLTSEDADWVVKTLAEIIETLPERDEVPARVSFAEAVQAP